MGSHWLAILICWALISLSAACRPPTLNQLNYTRQEPNKADLIGTWVPDEATLHWLVTDQLGTPRMIFDQSGSLANVSRHDYLPFGEELFAGQGSRTQAQGYTGDSTRQKFTGYEADSETGLNFAQARYQSPMQGRFTSPDPFGMRKRNPQSLNRYSYVLNNPLRYWDSTGLFTEGNGAADPFIGDPQDVRNAKIDPSDVVKIYHSEKGLSLLKKIFGGITRLFKGGSRTQSGEGEGGEEGESEEAKEEERKADEKDLYERSPWRDPNAIPPVRTSPSPVDPFAEDPSMARDVEDGSMMPRLNGESAAEQLRDAVNRVANSGGSPEAKAELMERFASQIRVRSEFEWTNGSTRGTDGSYLVFGRAGFPDEPI